MTSASPQRVALYIRCSTTEQARNGLSLEQQEHDTRQYANLYGLEVVELIVDAGASGKTLDRPGIARLRELIDTDLIDGIVICKLDRLARNVRDFVNLLHELESRTIALASVSDRIDTGSAAGRLLLHVMVAVAEWERDAIATRIRDALAHTKRQGTFLGQPPVGWRVQDGALVQGPRYAIVKRAHELRQGGQTLRRIASNLQAEGFVTGSGNAHWHPGQVKRLLAAPLLTAEIS